MCNSNNDGMNEFVFDYEEASANCKQNISTFQTVETKAQVNTSRLSGMDQISLCVLAQHLIRVNFSVTLVTSE